MTNAANLAGLINPSTGKPYSANQPTGSVLQVVSVSTNTKTSSSSSVSLMSATITPTSATSKILVLLSMAFGACNLNGGIQVRRNGTAIGTQAATTYVAGTTGFNTADDSPGANQAYGIINTCYNVVDSPASTSALTYDLYYQMGSGGTIYFNQQSTDNGGGAVSSITLMEIAG